MVIPSWRPSALASSHPTPALSMTASIFSSPVTVEGSDVRWMRCWLVNVVI